MGVLVIFSEIEALRKQGHSQREIAAMHGVSRQAVSWQKQTFTGYLTHRQVVNKARPWKATDLHGKSKVYPTADYRPLVPLAPLVPPG